MTDDKDKKIIEGEVLEETSGSPKAKQYVSEKFIAVVVIIIAVIIAGYFAYEPVRDWVVGFFEEQPEPTAEVLDEPGETEILKAEIERLQTRLAALENPEPRDEDDLDARFKALEEAIASLSDQPASEDAGALSEPDPRVDVLIEELAALRKEMAEKPKALPAGPNATFAQALAALSPALYEGRSYSGQLEQVRILILDMPALSQATLAQPVSVLSAQAGSGIPGLDKLREDFETAGVEALKVEGVGEDAGWWDKTWARVKGVVVVRRTDGGGSDLEQALATAEMHLDRGDLAKALVVVEALPPAEGKAFETWIAEAEKRQAALAAFSQLVEFIPRSASRDVSE